MTNDAKQLAEKVIASRQPGVVGFWEDLIGADIVLAKALLTALGEVDELERQIAWESAYKYSARFTHPFTSEMGGEGVICAICSKGKVSGDHIENIKRELAKAQKRIDDFERGPIAKSHGRDCPVCIREPGRVHNIGDS